MLLDLSGGYSHTANQSRFNSTSVRSSNIAAALSLGRRSYHRVDPHLYRWTTLGLSFLYNRQSSTQDTVTQIARGIGAGAFVNLGGTWLVSPHLGLGAQWQVDLTYTHNSGSTPTPTNTVSAGLGRVALTGQFYF
jgi:hypothetical protein